MDKFLLIFLIFFFLSGINTQSSDEIKKLEGNLLYNYINEDSSKVDKILEQIMALDESIYKRDLEIINYWHYIDDEMTLHEGVAPYYLPKTSDHAFVVLGFGLNDDGSLKDEGKGRCDVAYESAKKYPKSKIYITGGGTAKNNSTATESGQMKNYLVKVKGLNANRIVIEEEAKTTVQNARYTVKKLIENHIKTITIITSDYHIRRGNLIFKGEIMLKAESLGNTPIQIMENAVWKSNRNQTEGKLMEGSGLASIMVVKLQASLFLKHLPQLIMNFYNYYLD